MDSAITAIINAILTGGPTVLAAVGWCLYLAERYYIAPQREKQYREDLITFKKEYKELAEKTGDTIARFMTVLEIIKDRVGRQ